MQDPALGCTSLNRALAEPWQAHLVVEDIEGIEGIVGLEAFEGIKAIEGIEGIEAFEAVEAIESNRGWAPHYGCGFPTMY